MWTLGEVHDWRNVVDTFPLPLDHDKHRSNHGVSVNVNGVTHVTYMTFRLHPSSIPL